MQQLKLNTGKIKTTAVWKQSSGSQTPLGCSNGVRESEDMSALTYICTAEILLHLSFLDTRLPVETKGVCLEYSTTSCCSEKDQLCHLEAEQYWTVLQREGNLSCCKAWQALHLMYFLQLCSPSRVQFKPLFLHLWHPVLQKSCLEEIQTTPLSKWHLNP